MLYKRGNIVIKLHFSDDSKIFFQEATQALIAATTTPRHHHVEENDEEEDDNEINGVIFFLNLISRKKFKI